MQNEVQSTWRESTSPLFFPRRFPSYMPQLTECLEEARDKLSPVAQAINQVSSKYGWRYTVLTSLKKGETAVHCCDPALSVFHIVPALQSIVI